MRIGVPKEIKTNENRVALVPAGVEALVANGHEVFIEIGAGIVIDFSKYLNRIGVVNRDQMVVDVEPGVVLDQLNAHLRDTMLITGYSDEVRVVHTLRLWRIWMDRARMNTAETRLFRGLLRQARWKIGEARKVAGLPPLPPAQLSAREDGQGE